MNEPKPLRDDDAALDADERRLLRAGRGMSVPRGAKRAVWVALAAQLPGVAAATTSTAGVLTAASLVKYGAVGVLLGATTMTTVAVLRSPSGSSSAVTTTRVASTPEAVRRPAGVARESAPRVDALPAVPSAAPVAVVRPSAGPASPSVARVPTAQAVVDTEARRVAAARALTREGRPREALAALDAMARDLPNGELVQEREALAIEALLTLGARDAARRRATTFLERYPNSPHAAAARRALSSATERP